MDRFEDRRDAGRQLGQALAGRGFERPIVLGIPRGGVPVAAEVAVALGGELGVVVAHKLRAPRQPELAIGAVTADGVAWINEELAGHTGADRAYLEQESAFQAGEARRRQSAFDGHRLPPVAGRPVIIVDDGIATGATALAGARSMRSLGASPLVVAVPVGPPATIERLRQEADEVVCLRVDAGFFAVGEFYRDFRAVSDDEVLEILDTAARSARD